MDETKNENAFENTEHAQNTAPTITDLVNVFLKDLKSAFTILAENLPEDFNNVNIDEWKAATRKKILDAGIRPEMITSITPNAKLTEINGDDYEVEFFSKKDIPDKEEYILTIAAGLLVKWVFSDDPLPTGDDVKKIYRSEQTNEEIQEATESRAESKISYKNAKQVSTPTDKWINDFFSLLAPTRNEMTDGQRAMIPIPYSSAKSKNEIMLYFDYEYNDDLLKSHNILKGFTSYDYFIATILDNFFENGNTIISISKLLDEMGITKSSPGERQIEKAFKSLVKGATTTIHIDNSEVQKAWGTSDKYREIIGQVFPIYLGVERYIINGGITDSVIEINNVTPFRRIARSTNHVTTWNKEIFRLYKGRKTDRYWNVLHLLIREIGWMRHDKKRSKTILYSSFYEFNGDKTTREKQLTRDMLYSLLDKVFIPAGYVKAYKESSKTRPGVDLTVVKNTPALK